MEEGRSHEKNKMNKKRDERIIELEGKMRKIKKMSFQIMHNLFDFLSRYTCIRKTT